MPGIRARLQEFFGEKFFRDKVTFDKDVVFKKHITAYAPVPGEPSLGTPHPTADAQRTTTLVVDTSTNTAGVWSAAVTMTGVLSGAKAAYCYASVGKSGGQPYLNVEAATGYTLSDTNTGNNHRKYHGLGGGIVQAASEAFEGIVKIHLDANKQFKWVVARANNAAVQISSAIDYDI